MTGTPRRASSSSFPDGQCDEPDADEPARGAAALLPPSAGQPCAASQPAARGAQPAVYRAASECHGHRGDARQGGLHFD